MSTLTNIDLEMLSAAASPDDAYLSPTSAKAILKLGFSRKQHAEMQRLLGKNNQGTITPRERKKLEAYVRVGDILTLLKAKIRFGSPSKTSRR